MSLLLEALRNTDVIGNDVSRESSAEKAAWESMGAAVTAEASGGKLQHACRLFIRALTESSITHDRSVDLIGFFGFSGRKFVHVSCGHLSAI